MNKYNKKHYLEDLKSPEMKHIKDKERFKNFYDELGKETIQQQQQVVPKRIKFIEPSGKIIELGCHCGFNSIHYAKLGFSVIGVDISDTLIEEANRRLSKCSSEVKNRCKFICTDIEDLGQEFINKEGKFETIILTEVLEHCIDPDKLIEKSVSLLSESGKIYISAPMIRIGTYSHVRGIEKKYLQDQMKKNNLDYSIDIDKRSLEIYCIASKKG
tara:strand:- start:183 stop:827 length:645 start_codon:yes stop_codon:yes gene_type:complete